MISKEELYKFLDSRLNDSNTAESVIVNYIDFLSNERDIEDSELVCEMEHCLNWYKEKKALNV